MISAVQRPRTGHRAAIWADRVWPVLAGSLIAVGGVCILNAWGLASLLVIVVGTWAFVAVMTFGVLSEFGFSIERSLRTSAIITVVAVDLVGLMRISPAAGAIAATFVALTSPWATGRAASVVHRRTARASQRRVDVKFARIVADLERDSSWRTEA